jgi:hypothetical protein
VYGRVDDVGADVADDFRARYQVKIVTLHESNGACTQIDTDTENKPGGKKEK